MKKSYTRIAEHFSTDSDSIREYEYQTGRFTRSVFALSDNEYWAGSKPKDSDGLLYDWKPVISQYDGSTLWMCKSDAQEDPVSGRGGANRGQGRKPLSPDSNSVIATLRMTPEQQVKLNSLGGALWVREKIDQA